MDWIRKKLSKGEDAAPQRKPSHKKYPAPQPPEGKLVLMKRPSHKLTPAPAPPLPNTPQIALASTATGYDPPTNLFSGYKYPENVLNMWQEEESALLAPPIPDVREPMQRELLKDPVEESRRAWQEFDRRKNELR